jgi:MoxR-like ATPase
VKIDSQGFERNLLHGFGRHRERGPLSFGAGPRACQAMLLGAKAHALLDGRVHAATDDVRAVARPVMRHRLVTSLRAESEGVTADQIVERLFEVVPPD